VGSRSRRTTRSRSWPAARSRSLVPTAWMWASRDAVGERGRAVHRRSGPGAAGERARRGPPPGPRWCCSAIRSSSIVRSAAVTPTVRRCRACNTSSVNARRSRQTGGVLLPETWRMHPAITEFTSVQFYEGRLASRPGLEQQTLAGASPLPGAGLWLLPVPHDGNATTSDEEAAAIVALARRLLESASTWTDRNGECRRLTPEDILVVAPYNAHVDLIRERLHAVTPAPWRVGTVDKFQGQEAPIVIYAMGDVESGSRAAWARVPVQRQPAQRGDLPGQGRRRGRREPSAVRAGMPHTPADAARQRLVSLR
jgi:hypothetical protein